MGYLYKKEDGTLGFNIYGWRNRQRTYINQFTGEVSEHHSEAMKWVRDGEGVEIRANGKHVLTINPDPFVALC